MKDGRLTANRVAGVGLPRVVTTERRSLTVDQVERLAGHAVPYSLLVRALAYTGLRVGRGSDVEGRGEELRDDQ